MEYDIIYDEEVEMDENWWWLWERAAAKQSSTPPFEREGQTQRFSILEFEASFSADGHIKPTSTYIVSSKPLVSPMAVGVSGDEKAWSETVVYPRYEESLSAEDARLAELPVYEERPRDHESGIAFIEARSEGV